MDKLTRWLRLCALALTASLAAPLFSAELQPKTINDFSPGVVTDSDPSDICDGCAQDLLNVDVETKSVVKRRGSVKQNSTTLGSQTGKAARFLHEFVDSSGNFWMVSLSSSTLYKSNDAGATNSVLSSTHGLTTSSQLCAVDAYAKTRLTDGTTNWILFDGASVTTSTASPKGKTCEFFAERIWTSVGSQLDSSANGVPEDWTTDTSLDSDAFTTPVRQNDGYSIRSLKRFKSGLLVFKDFSLDLLTLNPDGLTFNLTPVSNRVGTQYPNSVVERENDVIWLAADGYYSYDGAVLRRISDPIRPTFFSIKQLSSGERSYTETSQAQFTAGTNSQTTATITAGDVLLSTFSDIDTSDADFGAFVSSSNVRLADNRVYLSTNNTDVINNSFETCVSSVATNWSLTGVLKGGCKSTYAAQSGTFYMELTTGYDGSNPYTLEIIDANTGSVIVSSAVTIATGAAWAQRTISLSSTAGRWVYIHVVYFDLGDLTGALFLSSGGNLTWYDSLPAATNRLLLDNFAGGRSSILSGSLTSSAFDTAFTSAAWSPSTPTYTTNGHSITFQTQSSSDGSSWNTATSWTPGSAPPSSFTRYLRYIVTLSTGGTTTGVAVPFVDDVTINARANNGRYLSSSINTGSGTSWNPFVGNASTINGGSQTFEVYTDTNISINPLVASTFISSQTVSNGAIPTITINSFAFVGSTFSITVGTQIPSMQDFTLSWNEGSSNFPVWSTYHQGSYISAVAISSDTGNDRMLIYDRNGAWSIYSYPAYTMSRYRNKPYFGSNLQGDIVRFQADGIYNDYDGSAVNSYWISKEFDFDNPLTPKTINRYYVTAKYRAGSDALFEWGVDRGTLTSETPTGLLDLDLNAGFFRKSIVPSSLTYKRGLSHRFKISDSDTSNQFDLLSVVIKADVETAP